MSIFLIALGAILHFAVSFSITGIKIETVGLILMIVGVIGLVISLAVMFMGRDDPRGVERTRRM